MKRLQKGLKPGPAINGVDAVRELQSLFVVFPVESADAHGPGFGRSFSLNRWDKSRPIPLQTCNFLPNFFPSSNSHFRTSVTAASFSFFFQQTFPSDSATLPASNTVPSQPPPLRFKIAPSRRRPVSTPGLRRWSAHSSRP